MLRYVASQMTEPTLRNWASQSRAGRFRCCGMWPRRLRSRCCGMGPRSPPLGSTGRCGAPVGPGRVSGPDAAECVLAVPRCAAVLREAGACQRPAFGEAWRDRGRVRGGTRRDPYGSEGQGMSEAAGLTEAAPEAGRRLGGGLGGEDQVGDGSRGARQTVEAWCSRVVGVYLWEWLVVVTDRAMCDMSTSRTLTSTTAMTISARRSAWPLISGGRAISNSPCISGLPDRLTSTHTLYIQNMYTADLLLSTA